MITEPDPGLSFGKGLSTISNTRGFGTVTTLFAAGFSETLLCELILVMFFSFLFFYFGLFAPGSWQSIASRDDPNRSMPNVQLALEVEHRELRHLQQSLLRAIEIDNQEKDYRED